ncbi:hypothetical protein CARUB_v10027499mg [Capsella rubella]|uniref:Aconitase A/isopropylmalate dehydratase small subunit swivel domain-containing protein n=1 Tax=Capsella rubella TaxID=81985 RepID=R0GSZ1_9BRAS|nr:hypothetical protein CARUB_v10027499mg [Capsella rubella]
MYRYSSSGVQFASSISKSSTASAPTLFISRLHNSKYPSVRIISAFRLFRVCSAAIRWSNGTNWKFPGVKAIIAKSFDRVHRSNLASMGIVPLCFKFGEDAETLELCG